MRRLVLALTLLCAAGLPACGQLHDNSAVGSGDADGSSVPYLSNAELQTLGLVVGAPPDNATSELTEADVVSMANWSTAQYADARPVRAVLRVATTTSAGRRVNGEFRPAVDHRLVWVLVAPDIRIFASGGARFYESSAPAPEFRGYEVDLIDAHTGENLKGYQISTAT